jgi:hypothetical protein
MVERMSRRTAIHRFDSHKGGRNDFVPDVPKHTGELLERS